MLPRRAKLLRHNLSRHHSRQVSRRYNLRCNHQAVATWRLRQVTIQSHHIMMHHLCMVSLRVCRQLNHNPSQKGGRLDKSSTLNLRVLRLSVGFDINCALSVKG